LLYHPSPLLGWGGECKEKGKKLVVRAKGSLTETANKVNSNNSDTHKGNIQKQTVKCTEHPSPPGAPRTPKLQ